MSIRTYKPTSASRRNMTNSTFEEITTSTPEKSLLVSLPKSGGRNNQGVITCRHIGGGHKRKYRLIDFKRNKDNIPAVVKTVDYIAIIPKDRVVYDSNGKVKDICGTREMLFFNIAHKYSNKLK